MVMYSADGMSILSATDPQPDPRHARVVEKGYITYASNQGC
jgi:hypothetical protein